MNKYFIDSYDIKHWQQGYTLSVGSMRPDNAPKYKQTEADFERRTYIAKINLDLAKSGRYFKNLTEIEEFISDLNK